jgi:CRP/FNR family transcriptional regulator
MQLSIFNDAKLVAEIDANSRKKSVHKEDVLISTGDEIVFVPLVMKGCLRIMRQDHDGREVFLYHIYPGQTCAMSLTCCQTGKSSMVKAVAEDDTDVLLIPVRYMEEWFKYPEWKAFVNNTFNNRFSDLLQVIDLIAFNNMDKQLLHYLQQRAKANQTQALVITHQQIADELHTHREAISRLLRTLEQKGMVKLGRNTIELL